MLEKSIDNLTAAIKEMTEHLKGRKVYVESDEPTNETTKEEGPIPIEVSLDEVRTELANVSRSGKATGVKKLIQSFDCEKLSDVDPKDYAKLLKKAKELK